MTKTPFPIKTDLKFRNSPEKIRQWFLGIPSQFWGLLSDVPYLPRLQVVLTKGRCHILLHATSEIRALSNAFSSLAKLTPDLNGVAIPVDRLVEVGELQADFLLVYPVSAVTPNWQLSILRSFWFKHSLIIPFKGTPKQFVEVVGLEPEVTKLVDPERQY